MSLRMITSLEYTTLYSLFRECDLAPVIKLLSCLTQLSTKFVVILTFVSMLFFRLLIFFKINFLRKFFQEYHHWTLIRPDDLSGLIWVQTVCQGYKQTTLVDKEFILVVHWDMLNTGFLITRLKRECMYHTLI